MLVPKYYAYDENECTLLDFNGSKNVLSATQTYFVLQKRYACIRCVIWGLMKLIHVYHVLFWGINRHSIVGESE